MPTDILSRIANRIGGKSKIRNFKTSTVDGLRAHEKRPRQKSSALAFDRFSCRNVTNPNNAGALEHSMAPEPDSRAGSIRHVGNT